MSFSKKASLRPLFYLLIGLCFFYILYHSFAGGTLFARNWYDSYSLQAENWLLGRVSIAEGAQYTWLELAIYKGEYYLSFPPVPSVLLLPWVLLCGSAAAVPANFIIALFGLGIAAGVYALLRSLGASAPSCLFWAIFCTMGSNTCWLSTNGGVWFMAQITNLFFVVWGLYFASLSCKSGNICAAACLALAVGCRPFSILLLAVFFLQLWVPMLRLHKTPREWHGGFWPAFCLAACIGGAMAWYNFIRFGNFLEFGHNYLPEFMEAVNGQFHLSYFWANLKGLFRLVTLSETLVLEFSIFNGFFLFAANPIFLLWLIRLGKRAVAHLFTWREIVLLGCMLLGLSFLCLHKTMGGWQFGARYLVDLIPYILLCEWVRYRPQERLGDQMGLSQDAPKDWEWLLISLAVMFNVYGAVYMLFQ